MAEADVGPWTEWQRWMYALSLCVSEEKERKRKKSNGPEREANADTRGN